MEAVEDCGFDGKALGRADSERLELRIDNLIDGSCAAAVEQALRQAPGVLDAEVTLPSSSVQVWRHHTTTCPIHMLLEGTEIIKSWGTLSCIYCKHVWLVLARCPSTRMRPGRET